MANLSGQSAKLNCMPPHLARPAQFPKLNIMRTFANRADTLRAIQPLHHSRPFLSPDLKQDTASAGGGFMQGR